MSPVSLKQGCSYRALTVGAFRSTEEAKDSVPSRMNIEEMYTKVRTAMEDGEKVESKSELSREAFWREMNQTEDSFETIARFFAKGVIQ